MSPEVVCGEVSEASESTMSFAIGMILYEMLLFKMAYDELDGQTAGVRLSEGELPRMGWLGGTVFEKLIVLCLSVDPQKRPGLESLKREFHELLPAEMKEGVTSGETGSSSTQAK